MYESYRYVYQPYNLLMPSLEEYLNKGRKNHVFYGLKFSISEDGYYDEYMEFGKHAQAHSRRKPDRYIQHKILDELDDPNKWLHCYINIENFDEYMVVTCCRIGTKMDQKCRNIFTVLKEDR